MAVEDSGSIPGGRSISFCFWHRRQVAKPRWLELVAGRTLADAWAQNGVLVPTAGFFAGSEIGPVGYRSYTHSHVASLALFRPRAT